jgi:exopolysaccharide production protein ExoZ
MKRNFILSIDVFRFLAALAVAFFHLSFKSFFTPKDLLYQLNPNHGGAPDLFRAAAFGWIGVQLFFVISGFVIAYSVQNETVKTYTRRRALRLIPAVWLITPLCLIISVVFLYQPGKEGTVLALRTLAFFPIGPWLLGQFWTIPIEIAFYGVVGILLGLGRLAWLERFAIGLATLSALYWVGDAFIHIPSSGQRIVQLLLLQHGIYFAIGIVFYKARQEGLTPMRLLFLIACCIPAFLQIRWASQWEAVGFDPIIRSFAPFAIWLALTAAMLFAILLEGPDQPAWLVRPVRALGLATYPLYLLHYHLGGAVLVAALGAGVPPAMAVSLAVLTSITLALLIAIYAETAMREGLSHLMTLAASHSSGFKSRLPQEPTARPARRRRSMEDDLRSNLTEQAVEDGHDPAKERAG